MRSTGSPAPETVGTGKGERRQLNCAIFSRARHTAWLDANDHPVTESLGAARGCLPHHTWSAMRYGPEWCGWRATRLRSAEFGLRIECTVVRQRAWQPGARRRSLACVSLWGCGPPPLAPGSSLLIHGARLHQFRPAAVGVEQVQQPPPIEAHCRLLTYGIGR